MRRSAPNLASAVALCALSSCTQLRPPPVVVSQQYGLAQPSLEKLAVAPFRTHERVVRAAPADTDVDAARFVERFVAEEIAARGIEVVPASDVQTALAGAGGPISPADAASAASAVAQGFGATAVMLGEVTRYRERVGAEAPASVAFDLVLYAAPSGKKLWSVRFDETQVAISDAPGRARRYPGSGTRWLTAAQLARFGARAAAQALAEAR